jgi:hypothetical protein
MSVLSLALMLSIVAVKVASLVCLVLYART